MIPMKNICVLLFLLFSIQATAQFVLPKELIEPAQDSNYVLISSDGGVLTYKHKDDIGENAVFVVEDASSLIGISTPVATKFETVSGAKYVVRVDSVAGYAVDGVAVIPVSSGYAVLTKESSILPRCFGAIANDNNSDTKAFEKLASFQKARFGSLNINLNNSDTFRLSKFLIDEFDNVRIEGNGAVIEQALETINLTSDTFHIIRFLDCVNINISDLTIEGRKNEYTESFTPKQRPISSALEIHQYPTDTIAKGEVIIDNLAINQFRGRSGMWIRQWTEYPGSTGSDGRVHYKKGYRNININRLSSYHGVGVEVRGLHQNVFFENASFEADTSSIYGDSDAYGGCGISVSTEAVNPAYTNVYIRDVKIKYLGSIFLQNTNTIDIDGLYGEYLGYYETEDTIKKFNNYLSPDGNPYPYSYLLKTDHVFLRKGFYGDNRKESYKNIYMNHTNGAFHGGVNIVEGSVDFSLTNFRLQGQNFIRKEDPNQGIAPARPLIANGRFVDLGYGSTITPDYGTITNVDFMTVYDSTAGIPSNGVFLGRPFLSGGVDQKLTNCNFYASEPLIPTSASSITFDDCNFINAGQVFTEYYLPTVESETAKIIYNNCEGFTFRLPTLKTIDTIEIAFNNCKAAFFNQGLSSSTLYYLKSSPSVEIKDLTVINRYTKKPDPTYPYWDKHFGTTLYDRDGWKGTTVDIGTNYMNIPSLRVQKVGQQMMFWDQYGTVDKGLDSIGIVAQGGELISGLGFAPNDTIFLKNDFQKIVIESTGTGWKVVENHIPNTGVKLWGNEVVAEFETNTRYNQYGQGNKTAAAVSKTKSTYLAGFATDGTIVETTTGTGWAQYKDTTYTSLNKISIAAGDTITLPNDAGIIIDSQLPTGVTSFWSVADSTFTPENIGDAYAIRIDFMAENSSNDGYGSIAIDIGGSQEIILESLTSFPKGSGVAHSFSTTSNVYTLNDFVTNGGKIKFIGGVGTTQIWNINIVITRTHKVR
jgi:hypothetical protein